MILKSFCLFLLTITLISFNSLGQNLEIAGFLGRTRHFGYVQGKSESSSNFDKFRCTSTFDYAGGITGTYFLNSKPNDNLGLNFGIRYLPSNYNIQVRQPSPPVVTVIHSWTLESKLIQIPVGLTYKWTFGKKEKQLLIYSNLNINFRNHVLQPENSSFTLGNEPPSSLTYNVLTDFAKPGKVNLGGDFGLGFTPFSNDRLKINLIYSYDFSYQEILNYTANTTYLDGNNVEKNFSSQGKVKMRPTYVLAQLAFTFSKSKSK